MKRETQFLDTLLAAGVAASIALAAPDGKYLVYVGTYTNWEVLEPPHRTLPGARSEGIYAFRFDSARGRLEPLGLAAAAENPTFLSFSSDARYLYAANELYHFHDQASGAVSVFSVDRASGKLTFLNQVAPRGICTCHVRTDHTGRFLLLANYGSGSVAVAPVKRDGTLGAVTSFVQRSGSGPSPRQAGPHTHSLNVTPDNRYAVAADLGADKLFVYRFDAGIGALTATDPPLLAMKAGSGPRHLSFRFPVPTNCREASAMWLRTWAGTTATRSAPAPPAAATGALRTFIPTRSQSASAASRAWPAANIWNGWPVISVPATARILNGSPVGRGCERIVFSELRVLDRVTATEYNRRVWRRCIMHSCAVQLMLRF